LSSSSSSSSYGGDEFGTWRDPEPEEPRGEWEERLNAYAEKAAERLAVQQVPLFRSTMPRDGLTTYRDAFWVIAVDVDRAARTYVASETGPAVGPGSSYAGWLTGTALLLTRSGILCHASGEGILTAAGGVDDHEMDMAFTRIGREESLLKTYDWGWFNRGRWRRDARSDLSLRGVPIHTNSIAFQQRYFQTAPIDDAGRGTSAAISSYLNTKGSVQWPRGFVSFEG
jgi:hypothetical protein